MPINRSLEEILLFLKKLFDIRKRQCHNTVKVSGLPGIQIVQTNPEHTARNLNP